MPRKQQIRPFQDEAKVIDLCGFDTKESYQQWIRSEELFKDSWNRYNEDWLRPQRAKATKRKKEATLSEVRQRLTVGEANGRRKYSRRTIKPEQDKWDGADWLAWLLLDIVNTNTSDVNGIFYEKGLALNVREDAIWQVIQRSSWMSASSRKTRSMDSIAQPGSSSESSTPASHNWVPQIKSTVGGEVKLCWDTIPREIERAGSSPNYCYIDHLQDLDWASFRQNIDVVFNLKGLKLRPSSLSISDDVFALIPLAPDESTFSQVDEVTFVDLKAYSLRLNEPLRLNLRTVEALESLISQNLEGDEPATLLQPYDLMVSECSGSFNEKERFWIWARLRNVSNAGGGSTARVTGVTVAPEEINTEREAIMWLRQLDASNALDNEDDDQAPSQQDDINAPIHEISEAEIEKYREAESYLDNLDYERQGRIQACQALGIANPDKPRIPGMRLSATLEPWQPAGIKALVDFEEGPLSGGILADLVGFGKTWELVGLLQFTDEIQRITDDFQIKVYYGSKLEIAKNDRVQKLSKVLTNADPLFDGSEWTSGVIILTTYNTFRNRHGPSAYKKYLVKEAEASGNYPSRSLALQHVNETTFKAMPTDPNNNWPRGLGGCFERLILDEGHKIRNRDTLTWTSIRWLRAPNINIATATPLIDGVKDFTGLIALLQPRDDLWTEESLQQMGIFDLVPKINPDSDENEEQFSLDEFLGRFDPWNHDNHPYARVLKESHKSFMEHVVKYRGGHYARGTRIRSLFKGCVVRRTYSSLIDSVPIGRKLPMIQKNRIECNFTSDERLRYDSILKEALQRLHRKKGDDIVWDTNVYRRLLLCGTWLDFKWLLHYKVKKLKEFRKADRSALEILKDASEAQIKARVDTVRRVTVPPAESKEEIMLQFARNGPKLRVLAQLIADICVMLKEKVVIWCSLPTIQLLLEKFLQEGAIDARSYHANLNLDERKKLSDQFNGTDEVQQRRARNCIFFDPPPSKGLEDQALGRVYRVGQRNWVRLIRLELKDSFEDKIITRNVMKALPGIMAELNLEVFGDDGAPSQDVRLGKFTLKDGDLVSMDDVPLAQVKDYEVLTPDVLLVYIHKLIRGEPLKLTKEDKKSLEMSDGSSTST
ncbi:hypothetical protein SLS58_004822 [Diplodia intermedia]|uniref:SNF2 N-terminal domain-containing protein n=1 Tax=Diplodia intermedia TaxID=856260 RepID=A0ABR3TSS6_9PEZI